MMWSLIQRWYRDKIQQKHGLPIEAREAKNGKKLEDGLYRATLRHGTRRAGCCCAVGEHDEEVHIQPITGTLSRPTRRLISNEADFEDYVVWNPAL